ncbi:MAG TPA: glutamate--tRNA ligase [Nitrososphaerales archaeon]|nr:glutamate--tRNA ligase [Nitrososphaerales archaeon]
MVDGDGSPLSPAASESIERNALLNATRHGGTAEVGAIMSKVLGEFPELRSSAPLVARAVQEAVRRVNSMGPADQEALLASKYPGASQPKEKEGRVGLPPLANAVKGRAVFRLPPEPSGFMHLGHAMAFTVNFLYRQEYEGRLWLRFEDTNPKKVQKRYYESFRKGIQWLGITCDAEKNVSEDNEVVYGYGGKLLEEGKAYACSCDEARVKKLRFEGTPCEHRDQNPEASIRVWQEMLARKQKEGSWVIRLKGDMQSLNFALRDPNIFRIIDREHPVTGSKYVVWPTYYMANTVEDEICGVTHVLRSSEFQVDLQKVLREKLSFRDVDIVQFSRYNFKGTPVAKRLLRPLVEGGQVSGWDDPRMPTVAGIRRRGILPEAIRRFTLQVGYTNTEHEYDWSLLFAVNRKLLDPVSKRVFFVPDPVRLSVEGAPDRHVTIPFHPEKDLGSRTIYVGPEFYVPREDLQALEPGAVFRLLDLYNVKLSSRGPPATAEYAGDGLVPDTKKVQWVTPDHQELKVLEPGVLFDDAGAFNAASLGERTGFAEESFSQVKEGEIVQFPRFGFVRLDSPGTVVLAHK